MFIKVHSKTYRLSNNPHNNNKKMHPLKPTTNSINNNLKTPNKIPAAPTFSTNPIDFFSIYFLTSLIII